MIDKKITEINITSPTGCDRLPITKLVSRLFLFMTNWRSYNYEIFFLICHKPLDHLAKMC